MKKLLLVPLIVFGASCTKNTPLHSDCCSLISCQPIYGHASDWDVISDDLARNIYRHNRMCEELRRS